MAAPDEGSPDWRCGQHGVVWPLYVVDAADGETLGHVRDLAQVPLWAPDPLPPGWRVTGIGYVGTDLAKATVFACSGPAPLGGVADMLVVAEEPGVGLGAGYAGLDRVDPGLTVTAVPVAKVEAAGHPTALWTLQTPADRYAVFGEGRGVWLWVLLWPAEAGHVLAEHLVLSDLRDRIPADLPVGPPSPYLWHLYPDEPM